MRFSGLSKWVMGLKTFQSTAALRWIGFHPKYMLPEGLCTYSDGGVGMIMKYIPADLLPTLTGKTVQK